MGGGRFAPVPASIHTDHTQRTTIMANTNSTLKTAAATVKTSPRATIRGADIGGIMLFARGKVTCPATPTVNDTLTLLDASQIPPGAIFEPAASWVYCETDPGTALNLDIGFPSNPDAIADNLALTVAGHVGLAAGGTMPLAISAPAPASGKEDILATVVTSTAVVQTVIQFCLAYRVCA